MFIINEKTCPSCGVAAEKWEKVPTTFICNSCNTVFNEFGVIVDSTREEEVSFS